jgi:hypothetical protein
MIKGSLHQDYSKAKWVRTNSRAARQVKREMQANAQKL